MPSQLTGATVPIPPAVGPIRVSVRDLAQLYNSIDPSPFHERDLDAAAEEFILTWARDLPAGELLALVVHVAQPVAADRAAAVADAVHTFFARRAIAVGRD